MNEPQGIAGWLTRPFRSGGPIVPVVRLHGVITAETRPGLVAAIRHLLAVYNDAAGAELLTASEQSDGENPAVTIASHGSAHGTLTIAVDGDALLVHAHSGSRTAAAQHGIARRIDCSRSDAGTAAYLLQGWMDNL